MKAWAALLCSMLVASCATSPRSAAPAMAMWRLDCGTFDIDNLEGRGRVVMPVSCYLIRHGNELILFDAGLEASLHGKPRRERGQTLRLDETLATQLAKIGVDPAKVTRLIVSHYHGDHHGQADLFPNARLVMGAGDAAALRAESDQGKLGPWLNGQRLIEEVAADRDLSGDGKLLVLFTPGHTPGHLAMLVKLGSAAYVLSGDFVHSRSQLATQRPSGNHVDKARGKVEIERVLKLAQDNKATIIVGHDEADIGLLPAFPKAAE